MKHLSLLSILLIILCSCQNRDLPKLEKEADIRVSEEGHLLFKDFDIFNNTVSNLLENHETILDFCSLYDYQPYFHAWDAIDSEEYETIAAKVMAGENLGAYSHLILFKETLERGYEEELQINHPVMQWLTNEKGIVQIGDYLRKYTYDYLISVPLKNVEMSSLLKSETDFSDPKWQPYKTAIERMNLSENIMTRAGNNLDDQEYKPGSLNRRRIRGTTESFVESNGLDRVVVSHTKHQRKIGVVWVGDRVPDMTTTSSGYLIWGDQDTTFIDLDMTIINEKSSPTYLLGSCSVICLRTDIDIESFHRCDDCDGNSTYNNQEARTTFVMPW